MKNLNTPRTAIHLGMGGCLVLVMAAFGVRALAQTRQVPPTTTPPVDPLPAASAAPTLVPSQPPAPVGRESTVRIYMPDGQLKSHSIRVYVTRDILPNQDPRLQLLRSHAVTKKAVAEAALEPEITDKKTPRCPSCGKGEMVEIETQWPPSMRAPPYKKIG